MILWVKFSACGGEVHLKKMGSFIGYEVHFGRSKRSKMGMR
jgi:hypothetical protein